MKSLRAVGLLFFIPLFVSALSYAQLPAAPASGGAGGLSGWFWVAVVAVALGIGAWYLHRRFPSQSALAEAQAKSDLAGALSGLQTILKQFSFQQATLHQAASATMTKLTDTIAASNPPPPSPAPEPGKLGKAGPLTIALTGDAAADFQAFHDAYFAK